MPYDVWTFPCVLVLDVMLAYSLIYVLLEVISVTYTLFKLANPKYSLMWHRLK